VRLVICDDHRLLTEALAALLSAHGHVVEAVAYAQDDGLRAVAASHPDVCLLDLNFNGAAEGVTTARQLRDEHPSTKVVILSAVSEPSVVAAVIDAGVAGFIRKDQSASTILTMLDRVAAGEIVIDGDLLRAAVHAARLPGRGQTSTVIDFLTAKERVVLLLLVDGHTTGDIARSLGVAASTARTHVQNVLMKLGVHSRLQAAALVVSGGLLEELRSTPLPRDHGQVRPSTSPSSVSP
jgi:two-component system, NarL family, nitrate/nitrite response regulator NarL